MKKQIFHLIMLLLVWVSSAPVAAQGTLYISNLGLTPTGMGSVSSDLWIAQPFVTGMNSGGYILNSIQLLMDVPIGMPSGFTASLYSMLGYTVPANRLGYLSGSDPAAGGIFTCTAPSLQLSPDTAYFVVLSASTSQAQGVYNWSAATRGGAGDISTGWSIQDYYYSSVNGSSWSETFRQNIYQMSIYATPIPEPETSVLFGISLACLGFLRLRQTK
jgi:hypothetical protein